MRLRRRHDPDTHLRHRSWLSLARRFPRPGSAERFGRLLDVCESFAGSRNLPRLIAGVNTGRSDAYRMMIARKFRTDLQGVAMHRPDEPGYNRKDVYLIDDWR